MSVGEHFSTGRDNGHVSIGRKTPTEVCPGRASVGQNLRSMLDFARRRHKTVAHDPQYSPCSLAVQSCRFGRTRLQDHQQQIPETPRRVGIPARPHRHKLWVLSSQRGPEVSFQAPRPLFGRRSPARLEGFPQEVSA